MKRESRTPQIGDVVIVTSCHNSNLQHMGMVYEIHLDKYGHQRNVLIEWSTLSPRDYQPEHGYGGINIHNIRDKFEVIRNGKSIK
jgi:hypothetical protein